VRDGNFIEHDTDIDIGVFFEEWKECDVFDFIKRMLVFDLEIKYIFGDFTNNFEMSFVKNGIKTDFFFYRESVLEAKYGADWRTPNKGWDWAYDPKNIRLWK